MVTRDIISKSIRTVIAYELLALFWLLLVRQTTHIEKLYHVSLGLVYLHSERIIHGDIKGVRESAIILALY